MTPAPKHNQQPRIASRRLVEILDPPGSSYQNPINWVTTDASPGGIFMPARQFLGGNPETYVNSAKERGKSMQSYHGNA